MSDSPSSDLKSAEPAKISPDTLGLSRVTKNCTANSATWHRGMGEGSGAAQEEAIRPTSQIKRVTTIRSYRRTELGSS
eukprot:7255869-Pyramimonas_sp.AAC.1